MKKVLSLIMVGLVAGSMWTSSSQAGETYVSGNIGIVWMNDIEFQDNWTNDNDRFELGTDSGIALTGALGYDFGTYRAEIELGYQANDIASWTETDPGDNDPAENSTGDVSLVSLMLNGAYDIDLEGVEIYPFAGIGAAFISFDDASLCFSNSDEFRSKDAVALAYQIGAGVTLPVGDNVMVDARYRYFATGDFSFDKPDANSNIESHSAMLGLRVGI
ncbi:MAG TPA: porin family protein [Prosthecochloris aestuarii]|uniref:Porin family protein n=1 Tax=Prosthecochloris aestuarii TaxID=1102 RepID=A0A831SRW8_PROAE|nr:porin family protein [Prosthecochloris aestuarii]